MPALVKQGTLVLVVDDDVSLRESLVETLTIEGYVGLGVRSGEAALSMLAYGVEPSVVILDMWLADMSGGDFIQWLRASRHAATPVILHSGEPSARIDLDVDAIVRKPADSTTLVRMVDRLVASGSRQRPGDTGSES